VPWWFWVLLWAALLLGSVASAGVAGYWLVRKGLAVLREAGDSLGRLSPTSGWEAGGEADDDGADLAEDNPSVPGSAVFADPDDMVRAYAQGRAARRDGRRRRRIERRAHRGQPQSLRDLGLI
jgi:hypothetical protein